MRLTDAFQAVEDMRRECPPGTAEYHVINHLLANTRLFASASEVRWWLTREYAAPERTALTKRTLLEMAAIFGRVTERE